MGATKHSFPERLRQLRQEQELSQYALADALDFSRGLLGNYELGKREPDYDTLIILANFFEVSTDYMLGISDDRKLKIPKKAKPRIDHLMERILQIPKENQGDLEKYIDFLAFESNKRKQECASMSKSTIWDMMVAYANETAADFREGRSDEAPVLTSDEIKRAVAEKYEAANNGKSVSRESIIPSDCCYNWWNRGLSEDWTALFEYNEEDNSYRVLGEGYRYNGGIYAKNQGGTKHQVGVWVNGKRRFQ